MYYVYLLLLNDGSFYTGRSDNLKRRIREHNSGKVNYTKSKLPAKLIYYEAYLLKKDAVSRELFLKTGDGRCQVKKQLKNFLEETPARSGRVA